jgi:hypothetical protein
VMRIVGDECRAKGFCDLHIDAIAARAGVHRTTVQNALREGQGRAGERYPAPPSSRCRSAAAPASGASPTSSGSSRRSGRTGSARARVDRPWGWVQIARQTKNRTPRSRLKSVMVSRNCATRASTAAGAEFLGR